jgi:hypothetical protein
MTLADLTTALPQALTEYQQSHGHPATILIVGVDAPEELRNRRKWQGLRIINDPESVDDFTLAS